MRYDNCGPTGLDYAPCRYGTLRTLFRGPKADLTRPYAAFLGGTATFGKFIPCPYPHIAGPAVGLEPLNLGVVNAGPDVFLRDEGLLEIAAQAAVTVVQITGVPNLTNRYYSVHPRRNDRVLQASALLRTVYRDVDFTQFSFTRHMLQALQTLSPERFAILRIELQEAWLARVRQMLLRIDSPKVLLWMGEADMPAAPDGADCVTSHSSPLFINRQMVEVLKPDVEAVVEVVASPAALAARTEGMVFSQMEAAAAESQLSVAHHNEAAEALAPVLARFAPAGRVPVTKKARQ